MKQFPPLDWRRVQTYPLDQRPNKVDASAFATPLSPGASFAAFLDSLPDVLAARDLREVAAAIAGRHRAGKTIALGMGAHPIKLGLSPLIIDLLERGIVNAIAMNGAAIIHDFEIALQGATSEDVPSRLRDGTFGMARETADFLNGAIAEAARDGLGLGAGVGRALVRAQLPHGNRSILARAHVLGVPATVHVAIGTDILHMHPSADGAAIGQTSLRDFRTLTAVVAQMDEGVFVNLGSAVVIPETFLKALALARNMGSRVEGLVTVDMDFLRHYRPEVNVVQRPSLGTGKGYRLTGHHEILFPLLRAAILELISR